MIHNPIVADSLLSRWINVCELVFREICYKGYFSLVIQTFLIWLNSCVNVCIVFEIICYEWSEIFEWFRMWYILIFFDEELLLFFIQLLFVHIITAWKVNEFGLWFLLLFLSPLCIKRPNFFRTTSIIFEPLTISIYHSNNIAPSSAYSDRLYSKICWFRVSLLTGFLEYQILGSI